MHIYSLRLWLVMIAIFTGVSAAQAEDKCWILREREVTKGQPAGQPKKYRECLEGKLVTKNEMQVCERWNRGMTESEQAYYTDKECKVSIFAMLSEDTAKIPEEKKSDATIKAEQANRRDFQERLDREGRRQDQRESKGYSFKPKVHSKERTGPGTDPNYGGTDPGTGGTRNTVPTN